MIHQINLGLFCSFLFYVISALTPPLLLRVHIFWFREQVLVHLLEINLIHV